MGEDATGPGADPPWPGVDATGLRVNFSRPSYRVNTTVPGVDASGLGVNAIGPGVDATGPG